VHSSAGWRDEFASARRSESKFSDQCEKELTIADTAPHITEVGTVYVPVTDQDRALTFFIDQLGFEKRFDITYGGGHRWIEVAPPGAAHRIALVAPSEGMSGGGDIARCALEVTNIETLHASLLARGVDVDPEIGRAGTGRPGLVSSSVRIEDPVPPQFLVRDPDGNAFLIVEVS
jgi:catechol 2,3-dioxygenase-like lactoylglutathione lyase family enzyme